MEQVPLALLLRVDRRGAADIGRAVDAAGRLGLAVTGQGRASISARASPQRFAQLFGRAPVRQVAEPAAGGSAGRPAGYTATGTLPIPADLAEFVAEITVSAPAHRLD
jgi:hypothetical protein